MNVTQAGAIVNAIVKQGLGATALAAYEAGGIVSLGKTVINSNEVTETFMNTLVQRITRTIVSNRMYKNQHADMYKGGVGEWGGLVQKLKISVGDFQEDPAYALIDGNSVDQWTVHKPTVKQKFYYTEAPYLLEITRTKKQLKTAFLSEEGFAQFVDALYTEIRNKLEFALENLGRLCIANYIAEVSDTARIVKLVTNYNAAYGKTVPTGTEAMNDPGFLKYASRIIRRYGKVFKDISALYNDGTVERFTPMKNQVLKIHADFQLNLENEVLYNAFHDGYLKIGNFAEYTYWQDPLSPMAISLKRASDGEAVAMDGIVGLLYDYDAMGTFRLEEDVATTPLNAKGLYYNTDFHNKQLWYNDLSENCVVFTLT